MVDDDVTTIARRRTRYLNPGLRWEKVTSIEPMGIDATVCITVPDGNTYLSAFWEHNSQRIFANADAEYRSYWTMTALSDVAELEDAVNLWLAPELDSSEVGWFDLSNVVALQPPSVFAPPMVTDMLNAGVIDVADVAKILNLPAIEAPGEDASTAPIGEEAIQSGAQGGRSFLYRSSHRGPYHPGEGYRAVHHGMRLADNVFVKRLPLNRYTLDSGVWRVEERREKAITVRSLPRPVPQPMLAIELVAKADRNRQFREAGYRAAPKLVASGLVVKAADTGRVLMLQRRFDDEKDPARGKFEFPGGNVEPGEDSLDAAHREWEEEVGQHVPEGNIAGTWTSPNGVYRCYSEDTEVLTRRGWLTFDIVTLDDDIATRSTDGRFEWQKARSAHPGRLRGRDDLVARPWFRPARHSESSGDLQSAERPQSALGRCFSPADAQEASPVASQIGLGCARSGHRNADSSVPIRRCDRCRHVW